MSSMIEEPVAAAPPSPAPSPRPSGPADAKRRRRLRLKLTEPPSSAPDLLFANAPEKKLYWDRSHYDSPAAQMEALTQSCSLYVGNLAFGTTSQHLLALFSSVGHVAEVRLGLDRYKKTPCGFAFVEYADRDRALEAVACLSGSRLDGRVIRVELDAGFQPGRQYGRGVSGGQVRDERRTTVDPARSSGAGAAASRPRPLAGAKWEAPPQRRDDRGRPPQPRPYPSAAADGGGKRRREGEDQTAQRVAKNPRFREDGSDDEM